MSIKSLITVVSDYSNNKFLKVDDLPDCKNDAIVFKQALEKGLKVDSDNICICNENGETTKEDFLDVFDLIKYDLCEEDIFIFYFSGHGGKINGYNSLVFSDNYISLEKIIDLVENSNAKKKIVFIDSCYSGDFNIEEYNKSFDLFAEKGISVLASCRKDETSGFSDKKTVSLFTQFLYYSLTNHSLVRKGQKSLEMIIECVNSYMKVWNKKIQI